MYKTPNKQCMYVEIRGRRNLKKCLAFRSFEPKISGERGVGGAGPSLGFATGFKRAKLMDFVQSVVSK